MIGVLVAVLVTALLQPGVAEAQAPAFSAEVTHPVALKKVGRTVRTRIAYATAPVSTSGVSLWVDDEGPLDLFARYRDLGPCRHSVVSSGSFKGGKYVVIIDITPRRKCNRRVALLHIPPFEVITPAAAPPPAQLLPPPTQPVRTLPPATLPPATLPAASLPPIALPQVPPIALPPGPMQTATLPPMTLPPATVPQLTLPPLASPVNPGCYTSTLAAAAESGQYLAMTDGSLWEVRFGQQLSASLWFDGSLLSVCGGVIMNRSRNQVVEATPIAVCRETRISEVSRSGEVIVMNNGSVWRVSLSDQYKVTIWLPFARVFTCNNLIVNLNRGRVVRATRIA